MRIRTNEGILKRKKIFGKIKKGEKSNTIFLKNCLPAFYNYILRHLLLRMFNCQWEDDEGRRKKRELKKKEKKK